METDLAGSSVKSGEHTPTSETLLKEDSVTSPSKSDLQKDPQESAVESDVVTCATIKQRASTSKSSKPWRNASVMSNGFYPIMDQQGLPSPLSPSCIASVINTNFYSESSFGYPRKHSYQHMEDSGIDSAPDKIPKMSDDSCMEMKSPPDGLKAKRYNKTAEALKMSGLMDITMKTADLLKKNKQLQKEMDMLKKDSKDFLRNVLDNPENHHIRDTYFSHLDTKS